MRALAHGSARMYERVCAQGRARMQRCMHARTYAHMHSRAHAHARAHAHIHISKHARMHGRRPEAQTMLLIGHISYGTFRLFVRFQLHLGRLLEYDLVNPLGFFL